MPREPMPPSGRLGGAEDLLKRVAPGAARRSLREFLRPDHIEPNPWQPRVLLRDEDMSPLVESIRTRGIRTPLLVRRLPDGRAQLRAGRRRLEAAKAIGLRTVPATVVDVDDRTAIALTLTEALLREGLSAWEEAQALAELRETLQEMGQPADLVRLGTLTGRDEHWISERLTISERITPDVIDRSGRSIHDMMVLTTAALLSAGREDSEEARARRLREVAEAEGSRTGETGTE